MTNMASVLFGDSTLNARRKYHSQYQSLDHGHDHSFFHNNHDNGDDSESYSSQNTTTQVDRPAKGSLADFFFGFMYEEDDESSFLFDGEESALYRSSIVEPSTHLWNPLHAALCFAQALTSAAAAVPVSLMPVWSGLNTSTASSSSSSSHQNNVALPTAAAVLGAAIGKFINGPICDLVGARRCSVIYSILLSAALIYLSTAQTMTTVARACFWIEFANSIQWPAVIVTLATHHRNNTTGMYQAGVLVTSLASRLGSLSSILVSAWLLRQGGVSCATTALLGAWTSLVAVSVTYLLVSDAPNQRHQPQNPIVVTTMDWPQHAQQQQQQQKWNGATASTNRRSRSRHAIVATAKLTVFSYLKLAKSILQTNIVPSLQHILGSPTFWMVALAHTGACMVRTSERVLGTYFWQTSFTLVDVISSDNDNDGKQTQGESYHYVQIHALEQSKAAGLSVFFGIGTVAGLLTAGNAFASQTERRRKWLVWRLYLMAIVACYILAALGLSMVRHWFAWLSPPSSSSSSSSLDLLTIFQVMAVVVAGFGTAVQYYHIPSLVGASFGVDKGMFCAYVDGVALALASIVWGYWIGTNDATTTTPTTMTNVHSNDDANNASTTASTVMAAAYNENGWAYTWAAVALLLILSSVLMVEFMEHYFCRAARRISGTYETIILA